jgi:hypothetical protein
MSDAKVISYSNKRFDIKSTTVYQFNQDIDNFVSLYKSTIERYNKDKIKEKVSMTGAGLGIASMYGLALQSYLGMYLKESNFIASGFELLNQYVHLYQNNPTVTIAASAGVAATYYFATLYNTAVKHLADSDKFLKWYEPSVVEEITEITPDDIKGLKSSITKKDNSKIEEITKSIKSRRKPE